MGSFHSAMKLYSLLIFVIFCTPIDTGKCGVLSWLERSVFAKRSVQEPKRQSVCPSGLSRVCTCSDGSQADLSISPCANGSIDLESCSCPPGFSLQGYQRLGKGLSRMKCHRTSQNSNDTTEELFAPTCRCLDGTNANMNKTICGESLLNNCRCE